MALAVFLPMRSATATQRATPEQMAEFVAEHRAWLAEPFAHYREIPGAFLKQGGQTARDAVTALKEVREESDSPLERAAASYLLGEAQFWLAVNQLRQTRDRNAMVGVGDRVMGDLLAAHQLAHGVEDADAQNLRDQITTTLLERLRSSMCSRMLAPEMRERVIREFLMQADPAALVKLVPPDELVTAYTNLGAEAGLASLLPEKDPDSFDGLLEGTRLAQALGKTGKAREWADLAWSKHSKPTTASDKAARQLLDVLTACRSPNALACAEELSVYGAYVLLDAYSISGWARPEMSDEDRLRYLDAFLKRMGKETRHVRFDYIAAVLDRLIADGKHTSALRYVAQGEETAAKRCCQVPVTIVLAKARCLRHTGDPAGARAAYRNCLQRCRYKPEGFREAVERELAEIEEPDE